MANRVVIGALGGSYVIKVSKPGVNVLTAGAEDLLMDSTAEHFRVLQTGQITIPNGSSSANASVSGVGSSQLFFIVYGVSAGRYVFPCATGSSDLVVSYNGSTITVSRSGTSGSLTIAYAVLAL